MPDAVEVDLGVVAPEVAPEEAEEAAGSVADHQEAPQVLAPLGQGLARDSFGEPPTIIRALWSFQPLVWLVLITKDMAISVPADALSMGGVAHQTSALSLRGGMSSTFLQLWHSLFYAASVRCSKRTETSTYLIANTT